MKQELKRIVRAFEWFDDHIFTPLCGVALVIASIVGFITIISWLSL